MENFSFQFHTVQKYKSNFEYIRKNSNGRFIMVIYENSSNSRNCYQNDYAFYI